MQPVMTHPSRRLFLARAAAALPAALVAGVATRQARAAVGRVGDRPAAEVARDEDFWRTVQLAFRVDRSIINLNNGGVSPSTAYALDALHRHDDYANEAPAQTMWRVLEPQYESVRESLARVFGCEAEEVAVTRNATESLDNVLFGLDLRRGDEVLTTQHDYFAMIAALNQRVAREGIVLRRVAVPVPAPSQDALFDAIAAAISPRTRLILVSHVASATGQIFPVERLCRLGRERGIEVVIDGAHSFALLPWDRDTLGCDYFGASLHKWMNAPIGSGLLYVRRSRIGQVWPLFGQGARDDIRKFESIGTHPAAHRLAIAEAVMFHETLGVERKAMRLRYLRDRWSGRFVDHPRVRFLTNLNAVDGCAIASVSVEGMTSSEIHDRLWSRHKIVTSPIRLGGLTALRVTPGIYTTLAEVDRFADALATILDEAG